ncbi:MAG: DNA-protecting protein DprA [Chloroflexi bacterium]|nr:DNA-protecting protein DprA [Chloroflexota bacterium]
MTDLPYWVGLNLIPGIGRVKFSLLETYFGDLAQAWKAGAGELKSAGLDGRTIAAIIAKRPQISPQAELERLERHRVKALTWKDPAYPPRLKQIYDLPPILYVRGNLLPDDEWAVAVVGTRRATSYGKAAAEDIVDDLARSNITIVSGLAKGIDAIAHQTALKNGGRTIAVMGCGLDMVYPADHLSLARAIMEQGALVSDYPLGTPPKAQHFPRRNRVMSGLCLGVLVIEAGEGSGALITAQLALEQNREVFALPGPIFSPTHRGAHRLIQEGAKLVQGAQDVLEELNLTMTCRQPEVKPLPPLSDTESLILCHLSTEPTHIDEVRWRSGLPMTTVSSTLALLELSGQVRQMGGMHYVLASRPNTH